MNELDVHHWAGRSRSWFDDFAPTLADQPNIVAAIAMGSAVRDRVHRRSDFDFVIVYENKRPKVMVPLEVDLRLYKRQDIEVKLASGHEVIGWAMRFGVLVYDKHDFWKNLSTKWKNRVPLPSAEDAFERGLKTLEVSRQMAKSRDESAADDLILAAITQFVRERLIRSGVYPASRPELPRQLLEVAPNEPMAFLLEDAMYGNSASSDLIKRLDSLIKTDLLESNTKLR